jgi:hypothetical protein
VLVRLELPGPDGAKTVAPEQPDAGSSGAIARVGDLRGKRTLVDVHQQRFEARTERLERLLRRQVGQRRELLAAEAGAGGGTAAAG